MTPSAARIVCDLSAELGLIEVSGEDALAFLQGQLTNDASLASAERAQWTGHCTAKGRLLFIFLLWQGRQSFLLQLPRALREAAQKRIGMYVLRSKVKLADASDRFASIGLAGEQAPSLLRALGIEPPRQPLEIVNTAKLSVIALPRERYLLLAPASEKPALTANADVLAWRRLEIEAGIPRMSAATQDQFVPQMVNLDLIGGVSFNKGCYTGQEIVARTHYLGKVKRRMLRMRAPAGASPQAGDPLFSAALPGQPAGMVVNAVPTPDGGAELLAVVQLEFARHDALHWQTPNGPVLSALDLPYAL